MFRIGLFLLTNFAILIVLNVTLSILMNVFGIRLDNYGYLFIMAAFFGMGGSLISLAMSKWLALRSTGAEIIERPANAYEAWLVETVKAQAKTAGIGMPDVAIYHSSQPNAFATGMNKNNALVAVSTGLVNTMNQDEIEAVLGHEISHVANGDMVTLTLLQGVINTFVIFLARVIGRFIDQAISGGRGQQGVGIGYFIIVMITEVILAFLASIIVFWFSRLREYRADEGGAKLAGKEKMIAALEKLKLASQSPSDLPGELTAFGIRDGHGKLSRLFMSHPPLEERIEKLRGLQ